MVVASQLKLYSVGDLCLAIDGNADDEWHRERAKHELTYVLRDAGKVDSFIALAERQAAQRLNGGTDSFGGRVPSRPTAAQRTFATVRKALNDIAEPSGANRAGHAT